MPSNDDIFCFKECDNAQTYFKVPLYQKSKNSFRKLGSLYCYPRRCSTGKEYKRISPGIR